MTRPFSPAPTPHCGVETRRDYQGAIGTTDRAARGSPALVRTATPREPPVVESDVRDLALFAIALLTRCPDGMFGVLAGEHEQRDGHDPIQQKIQWAGAIRRR